MKFHELWYFHFFMIENVKFNDSAKKISKCSVLAVVLITNSCSTVAVGDNR